MMGPDLNVNEDCKNNDRGHITLRNKLSVLFILESKLRVCKGLYRPNIEPVTQPLVV